MQLGWVYEPMISYYENILLYNALCRHNNDFYYAPVAIARREETGMKYRFLCIAKPKINPNLPSNFAVIEIYKPPMGMPYCTRLSHEDFD